MTELTAKDEFGFYINATNYLEIRAYYDWIEKEKAKLTKWQKVWYKFTGNAPKFYFVKR